MHDNEYHQHYKTNPEECSHLINLKIPAGSLVTCHGRRICGVGRARYRLQGAASQRSWLLCLQGGWVATKRDEIRAICRHMLRLCNAGAIGAILAFCADLCTGGAIGILALCAGPCRRLRGAVTARKAACNAWA
jgi:hypothetical protein